MGLVESCQDVSGGGLAVAIAEMATWGDPRRDAARRRGRLARGRAVRESPSRLVVECVPRHVPALCCWRGTTGCRPRARSTGGERLFIELAGEGATGRRRGARQPDRGRGRGPDRRPAPRVGARLARALGWEHPEHGGDGGRAEADHAARGRAAGRRGPALMCGVVGVVRPDGGHEAASVAATALFALQHRGQESAGVGVSDGSHLMIYKDLGMGHPGLDERRIPSL